MRMLSHLKRATITELMWELSYRLADSARASPISTDWSQGSRLLSEHLKNGTVKSICKELNGEEWIRHWMRSTRTNSKRARKRKSNSINQLQTRDSISHCSMRTGMRIKRSKRSESRRIIRRGSDSRHLGPRAEVPHQYPHKICSSTSNKWCRGSHLSSRVMSPITTLILRRLVIQKRRTEESLRRSNKRS